MKYQQAQNVNRIDNPQHLYQGLIMKCLITFSSFFLFLLAFSSISLSQDQNESQVFVIQEGGSYDPRDVRSDIRLHSPSTGVYFTLPRHLNLRGYHPYSSSTFRLVHRSEGINPTIDMFVLYSEGSPTQMFEYMKKKFIEYENYSIRQSQSLVEESNAIKKIFVVREKEDAYSEYAFEKAIIIDVQRLGPILMGFATWSEISVFSPRESINEFINGVYHPFTETINISAKEAPETSLNLHRILEGKQLLYKHEESINIGNGSFTLQKDETIHFCQSDYLYEKSSLNYGKLGKEKIKAAKSTDKVHQGTWFGGVDMMGKNFLALFAEDGDIITYTMELDLEGFSLNGSTHRYDTLESARCR